MGVFVLGRNCGPAGIPAIPVAEILANRPPCIHNSAAITTLVYLLVRFPRSVRMLDAFP